MGWLALTTEGTHGQAPCRAGSVERAARWVVPAYRSLASLQPQQVLPQRALPADRGERPRAVGRCFVRLWELTLPPGMEVTNVTKIVSTARTQKTASKTHGPGHVAPATEPVSSG